MKSYSEFKHEFSPLFKLPVINWRKVGMTSSLHDPYGLGYTRVTMVNTKRSNDENWSKSQKIHPSSDCSLQLENIKPESLVIVDQHATVNLYLGLVLPARHTPRIDSVGSLIVFFSHRLMFENISSMTSEYWSRI